MADAVISIPTMYYETFPEASQEWTSLPLMHSTIEEMMAKAIARGTEVQREEVDAVHRLLLGVPMPEDMMLSPVTEAQEPPPETTPAASAEAPVVEDTPTPHEESGGHGGRRQRRGSDD